MLPSAVNDTMRDMMAQIRDCGDGIRDGTYTMTAPKITGGTITGATLTGNTFTSPVISGGSINNTPIGATTANTGAFTTLSATGVTTVQAGTVSAPAITTSGDTNTGIFFPAADTIAFTEGGVESMRIDSSGNVGIGTASPTQKLDVVASNSQIHFGAATTGGGYLMSTVNGQFRISGGAVFDGSNWIAKDTTAGIIGVDGDANIKFFTNTSLTSGNSFTPTERMRILSTGNILSLAGGSTTATGTGIAFPATQSASSDANTLDDYEEGTFTPSFTFSSGSVTYSTQTGAYTKIGRLVNCTIAFGLSGTSSPSGSVGISGLPFTNGTGQNFVSGASIGLIRNLANSYPSLRAYVDQSATTMSIATNATDAGGANLQGSDLTSSTLFYLTVTYQAS
jgi:hypothetical protein